MANSYKDESKKHFFAIADTILLFKKAEFEDYLKKLVKKLVDANLPQDKLKEYTKSIRANIDCYKTSPSILSLVQMRIKWLEEKIKPSIEFSWRMSGSIQGHPQVERFLRSELTQMDYHGVLNGVANARNFIKTYSGVCNGFSLSMNYTGTGSKVVLHITKTRDYYNSEVNNLNLMKSELKSLKKLIASV